MERMREDNIEKSSFYFFPESGGGDVGIVFFLIIFRAVFLPSFNL